MNEKSLFSEQLEFPQTQAEKISIIESILFASGETVPIQSIQKALGIFSDEMDELIEYLQKKYQESESGLSLSVSNETLQLKSKALNYPFIEKVLELSKRRSLSQAANEVLAILAYQQPLTRIEIEKIRGVNSSGTIQKLIDMGLIEECGRKEVPGRPYLYQTTDLFLHTTGISKIEELPSFDTFSEKDLKNE